MHWQCLVIAIMHDVSLCLMSVHVLRCSPFTRKPAKDPLETTTPRNARIRSRSTGLCIAEDLASFEWIQAVAIGALRCSTLCTMTLESTPEKHHGNCPSQGVIMRLVERTAHTGTRGLWSGIHLTSGDGTLSSSPTWWIHCSTASLRGRTSADCRRNVRRRTTGPQHHRVDVRETDETTVSHEGTGAESHVARAQHCRIRAVLQRPPGTRVLLEGRRPEVGLYQRHDKDLPPY